MTAITPGDTDTNLSSWTDRQIADGRQAPDARGMTPDDAAAQHNEANALSPEDPDDLYTPDGAQQRARDLLTTVGIEVGPTVHVVLTDGSAGSCSRWQRVNPGQLEAAAEQHRLMTGEALSADAIMEALPWE